MTARSPWAVQVQILRNSGSDQVQLGRIAVSNWVLASPSAIQAPHTGIAKRFSGGHRPQA